MRKLKLFSLLLFLLIGIGQVWAAPVTVLKSVHDIYPNDDNGTQECSLWDDGTLSISVNCSGNNGKVYGTGTEWRLYQSNSAVVTVAVTSGELSSVTFNFSTSSGGKISYNSSALTSGTAKAVSGSSATFAVGNTGTATNGQVKISSFSVTYSSGGSSQPTDFTDHSKNFQSGLLYNIYKN